MQPRAQAASVPLVRLAAAWEGADGFTLGVLAALQSIAVPTRAHGLLPLPDSSMLAVARRPGDWLLRWSLATSQPVQWQWAEAGRAFNGHVIASPDGKLLYTTESDLDIGVGLVGVRDARSLVKQDEWPTFGTDPHKLIWDQTDRARPALLVANGGLPTRPETGRAKLDLAGMDSSLVKLDANTGAALGQWRLADRPLSLRHLAWQDAAGPNRQALLGFALQSEHESAALKDRVPVLALFDGTVLTPFEAVPSLAGYGSAICALPDGSAVGFPRANGVAMFTADGAWRELVALPAAGAVAATECDCWAAGQNEALRRPTSVSAVLHTYRMLLSFIWLENHWAQIPQPPYKLKLPAFHRFKFALR